MGFDETLRGATCDLETRICALDLTVMTKPREPSQAKQKTPKRDPVPEKGVDRKDTEDVAVEDLDEDEDEEEEEEDPREHEQT